MTIKLESSTHARIIGVLSVCTLVTILIAGLWPFQAPLNDVSWLDNENELRFGHRGSLLSSSAFRPRSAENTGAGTLEDGLGLEKPFLKIKDRFARIHSRPV